MTSTDLSGTAAIVIGGAGGLGEAVVRRLHEHGAAVVIADLDGDRARELADELVDSVVHIRTDVTDSDSVSAAIEAASRLGPLRSAVLAQGGWGVAERIVQRDGSPASLEGFTRTLDLYLTGTYNVLRLVSAHMATNDPDGDGERGAIVQTASIAGFEGQIGQSAYAAAKAGVIGLTLSGARDLATFGIRLNTIAPGTMQTAMMESVGEPALERFRANVPFPKRLGRTSEFADLALGMLTNHYLNGEVVRLDGAQRFTPR